MSVARGSPAMASVIAALTQAGCEPRQVGPGLWLAVCPSCRERGRRGVLEVRRTLGGFTLGCDEAELRYDEAELP